MSRPVHSRPLALAFLLSGVSALICQVLWTRLLGLVLGNTVAAVSVVLAAFMAGLALGGYGGGRLATRLQRPWRGYVLLECLIGLYVLITAALLPHLDALYLPLARDQGALGLNFWRFLLSAAVVGVGAALMGATLPLIARLYIQTREQIAPAFAFLYGLNTLGAVLGVVLAGYWLIPAWGIREGLWAAAALNVAAALLVGWAARRVLAVPAPAMSLPEPSNPALLWLFAWSGFFALACEVLWTRLLSLVIGSSVYAFTNMLSVFLAGIALGALCLSRLPHLDARRWLAWLLTGLGLWLLASIALAGQLPLWFVSLAQSLPQQAWAVRLLELLLSWILLFPLAFLLGLLFPLLLRHYVGEHMAGLSQQLGKAYAANTLGAVLGALLAGFAMIPLLGSENALKLLVVVNAMVAAIVLWSAGAGRVVGGTALLASLLLLPLLPRWDAVLLQSNFPYLIRVLDRPDLVEKMHASRALWSGEDSAGRTLVYRAHDGSLGLNVNGHNEGSTGAADVQPQLELGLLPAVLHPHPRRVLVIGLGTGMTLRAVASMPGVEAVDCVEISSGVIQANHWFYAANGKVLQDSKVRLIEDDARHYLRLTDQRYDLIISAPSYSWVSGSASLFTRDFYEIAKTRLNPGGVLAAWFHLYDVTPPDIRRFVATFNSAFNDSAAWLSVSDNDLILLGGQQLPALDYGAMSVKLHKLGIRPESLIALYLMGHEALQSYAAQAEINTDNQPHSEFSIPSHLYDWSLPDNRHDLIGASRLVKPPVTGLRTSAGDSAIFPFMGLRVDLPGWQISPGFANAYGFVDAQFSRQSLPQILFKNGQNRFSLSARPATRASPADLEKTLRQLSRNRQVEIVPALLGPWPMRWMQSQDGASAVYTLTWFCPNSQMQYLLSYAAADTPGGFEKIRAQLALGLSCVGQTKAAPLSRK